MFFLIWEIIKFLFVPVLVGFSSGFYFEQFALENLMQYGYLDPYEIRVMSWIVGIWMFGVPFGHRTFGYMDKFDRESDYGKTVVIVYYRPILPQLMVRFFISVNFAPFFTLFYVLAFLYYITSYPFRIIPRKFEDVLFG